MPGRKRHCLDGFLVEAERLQNFNVPDRAVFLDHEMERHRALIIGLAGLFGILRVCFEHDRGRADCAADAEDPFVCSSPIANAAG